MPRRIGLATLIAANVVFYCVLSYCGGSRAVAQADAKPAPNSFANAIEQRIEMVEQLREIKMLLKEQNALLQSGKVKVVVIPSR